MKMPPWLTGVTVDGHPYAPLPRRWALYRSKIRDYMDRVILWHPWGTLRVHRILRADDDRDLLHDHPFDFTSMIVSGGYVELRADGSRLEYGVGDVNRCQAEDAHTIVSVKPRTITLVSTGLKRRSWGFHTPDGWIPWRSLPSYLHYRSQM